MRTRISGAEVADRVAKIIIESSETNKNCFIDCFDWDDQICVHVAAYPMSQKVFILDNKTLKLIKQATNCTLDRIELQIPDKSTVPIHATLEILFDSPDNAPEFYRISRSKFIEEQQSQALSYHESEAKQQQQQKRRSQPAAASGRGRTQGNRTAARRNKTVRGDDRC